MKAKKQDISDPRVSKSNIENESKTEDKPSKKCGFFGLFCESDQKREQKQCEKRIREKYLLDMKKCKSEPKTIGGRKNKRKRTIKKKRKNK